MGDLRGDFLGQVVYAQGTCQPGFGLKVFPERSSIYVSVPNIPAPVLREIARFADVHLYGEEGDILYATPNLLGIHTISGGKRTFHLPEKVDVIYDLFADQLVAKNTHMFEVSLRPASTALFYAGEEDLILSMKPVK